MGTSFRRLILRNVIDLNTAGKLLLNKHLLQVDMSLGVVDQYRMASI